MLIYCKSETLWTCGATLRATYKNCETAGQNSYFYISNLLHSVLMFRSLITRAVNPANLFRASRRTLFHGFIMSKKNPYKCKYTCWWQFYVEPGLVRWRITHDMLIRSYDTSTVVVDVSIDLDGAREINAVCCLTVNSILAGTVHRSLLKDVTRRDMHAYRPLWLVVDIDARRMACCIDVSVSNSTAKDRLRSFDAPAAPSV